MTVQYEPEIDTAVWLAIREFVLSAVADCEARTAYNADTLFIAASRLAAWCWEAGGLELDRETVFHRDTIAHFTAVGLPNSKPSARGNIRSQLLRMSEVLLGRTASLRKLGALQPSAPSAPYSPQELVSLRNWSAAQSTANRRTNAGVLLALSLGAGLSASEIGELRVRDIAVDDDGVVLRVNNGRSRSVPVLRTWQEALVDRVSSTPPDKYAFRENHQAFYPNLISGFVARSQWSRVRPQTQRMRATWIVHHLTVGTPVVTLMRAAGVESLEAFTRYVGFVPRPSDAQERRMLVRSDT